MQIIARYYIAHIPHGVDLKYGVIYCRYVSYRPWYRRGVNLLLKLLQLTRSCIKKLISAKINKYFIQYFGKSIGQVSR